MPKPKKANMWLISIKQPTKALTPVIVTKEIKKAYVLCVELETMTCPNQTYKTTVRQLNASQTPKIWDRDKFGSVDEAYNMGTCFEIRYIKLI
jgi:hypothetical protein